MTPDVTNVAILNVRHVRSDQCVPRAIRIHSRRGQQSVTPYRAGPVSTRRSPWAIGPLTRNSWDNGAPEETFPSTVWTRGPHVVVTLVRMTFDWPRDHRDAGPRAIRPWNHDAHSRRSAGGVPPCCLDGPMGALAPQTVDRIEARIG